MENLTDQFFQIDRKNRNLHKKHKSFVIWLTGLSGSGKSTIADHLEQELFKRKYHTTILDGDNIRKGINNDLGFSDKDRTENLRRISEISKLMMNSGLITISAFISPLEKDRQMCKDIIGAENFIEVYLSTSLIECERRDAKGLYSKARLGEIKDFTGISSAYETPTSPDIEINTEFVSIEKSVKTILDFIDLKNSK
jgi:adenylylsulfate kinase